MKKRKFASDFVLVPIFPSAVGYLFTDCPLIVVKEALPAKRLHDLRSMDGNTSQFLGFTHVFWVTATPACFVYVIAFQGRFFFEKSMFFLPVRFTEVFF